MEVRSIYRYARISAFKVREVTRAIQGLPATDALDILRFTPKKAASLVNKTLKSAIANAENNNNLRVENLTVREAVVGEGPTIKRFIPRARGSAGPIRKRMSHIYITLTDEIPIQRRSERSKKKKTASKSAPVAKSPAAPASAPQEAVTPPPSEANEVATSPTPDSAATSEATAPTSAAAESASSVNTPSENSKSV